MLASGNGFVVLSGRDYIGGMSLSHSVSTALLVGVALAALAAPACGKSQAAAPLADVTASEHGFSPTSLKLPSGGPGSHMPVSFVRTTDKTCATEVVFPDLKIEQKLPLGQVVSVDLPTDSPKTLTFQCGMGMYKGAIVVSQR
jgi:plastocyanin domain-containing protein